MPQKTYLASVFFRQPFQTSRFNLDRFLGIPEMMCVPLNFFVEYSVFTLCLLRTVQMRFGK